MGGERGKGERGREREQKRERVEEEGVKGGRTEVQKMETSCCGVNVNVLESSAPEAENRIVPELGVYPDVSDSHPGFITKFQQQQT